MKSLIRKSKKQCSTEAKVERKVETKKVAQCCAKISKAVAGCHD